jgi:hypothetical protein
VRIALTALAVAAFVVGMVTPAGPAALGLSFLASVAVLARGFRRPAA